MPAARPEVIVSTSDEAPLVQGECGVGTVHIPAHAKHGPGRRRSCCNAWLAASSSGPVTEVGTEPLPLVANGPTMGQGLGPPGGEGNPPLPLRW